MCAPQFSGRIIGIGCRSAHGARCLNEVNITYHHVLLGLTVMIANPSLNYVITCIILTTILHNGQKLEKINIRHCQVKTLFQFPFAKNSSEIQVYELLKHFQSNSLISTLRGIPITLICTKIRCQFSSRRHCQPNPWQKPSIFQFLWTLAYWYWPFLGRSLKGKLICS